MRFEFLTIRQERIVGQTGLNVQHEHLWVLSSALDELPSRLEVLCQNAMNLVVNVVDVAEVDQMFGLSDADDWSLLADEDGVLDQKAGIHFQVLVRKGHVGATRSKQLQDSLVVVVSYHRI